MMLSIVRKAFALALLGCLVAGPAGAQSDLVTLHIGTPVNEYTTPILYAMRAGLFRQAGLKIEIEPMTNGTAASAALLAGAIQISQTNVVTLAIAHQRGIPFTILAPGSIWLAGTEGGLLVRNDSPLREAKDFNGKTISAASLNNINTRAVQAWIDQNGGDSRSLKFVEIPQDSAAQALVAGRTDAVALVEPAFAMAVATGKVRFVANVFHAVAPRFMIGSWIATNDWIAGNRAVAERFARVVAEASAYTNTHPNETLSDYIDFTKVDKALVLRMRRAFYPATVSAGDIQPEIDMMAKYKMLEKPFPAGDIISDAAIK
jgi:NitT/TauT family transport system substrate-binding protein